MRLNDLDLGRIVHLSALTALFIIGSAISTLGSITLDSTSSNGAFNSPAGLTSLTWSHTVNSCTNCVLYVGVSTYNTTAVLTPRVLSVTYGAQSMTGIGSQVSPTQTLPALGNSAVEMFSLLAPAAGTATITVTFATPVNYAVGNGFSFNGVSQTTPNSAFVSSSANSSTPALTISGTLAGDVALDILASTPTALFFAENGGQDVCTNTLDETTCSRGRRFYSNSFDIGAMSRKTAATTSVNMGWTLTSADVWAQGAIAIKPFIVTAAGAAVSGRVTTPYGIGIKNAVLTMTDMYGNSITTITNPFGYFRFADLESGQSYVLRVSSKQYRFTPRVLSLVDNLADLNIVAEPDAPRLGLTDSSGREDPIDASP